MAVADRIPHLRSYRCTQMDTGWGFSTRGKPRSCQRCLPAAWFHPCYAAQHRCYVVPRTPRPYSHLICRLGKVECTYIHPLWVLHPFGQLSGHKSGASHWLASTSVECASARSSRAVSRSSADVSASSPEVGTAVTIASINPGSGLSPSRPCRQSLAR